MMQRKEPDCGACLWLTLLVVAVGFIFPVREVQAGGCGLPALVTLTNSWLNGTNGVLLAGAATGDNSGYSVSSAGDVNGDGFADLLVGAKFADASGREDAGETYLIYGRSSGFPPAITLSSSWLDGTNGVILAGGSALEHSGSSVSSAGDVNGDGLSDLLVGASYASPSGRIRAGQTYLIYGRRSGLPALITLSSAWLDGTNGVLLAGAVASDQSGCSVSSAGDVNGDGFSDLLVGAHYADPSGRLAAGETYLIYGRSSGLPAAIILTNSWLDGVNGLILAGALTFYNSGGSVSSAGDVNGDGLADLLVSANVASPLGRPGAGETYLVYGRTNGLPATITLTSTWLDGTNGTLLAGSLANDNSGSSVSSAGDVNGDGFADVLVGAFKADPSGRTSAGETYLIYGRSSGLPSILTLTNSWLNGSNGVLLVGAAMDDNSGYSVSSAGDVNGDGFADVLVGANLADPWGGSAAGETYLIYGRSNGLPATITLSSDWLDGTNGIVLAGALADDNSGYSVSSAGDVNGDGLSDFLVGAYMADPSGRSAAGETYLIFGADNVERPVVPFIGSYTGGYDVVISGINLCNGTLADVTNVTLCGVPATVTEVFGSTQIVVTAGAGAPGLGDAVVYSVVYGVTISTNAFSYLGAGLGILGTNGEAVANQEAASVTKGTAFQTMPSGANASHTLSITNTGNVPLNILGWSLSGAEAALFTPSGLPVSIAAGKSSSFCIDFAPVSAGAFSAVLTITNTAYNADSNFVLHLTGSAYSLDMAEGPCAGGNSITISNGLLGNGADITNVTIGGVAAAITGQGTNWVTLAVPGGSGSGLADIIIQSSSEGETLLANAYTYNPAGEISVQDTGLPALITLTNTWLDGTNGVTLKGGKSNNNSGCSVHSAGDVNGDGFDDVLVGAYYADPSGRSNAGETYLIYGRSNGLPAAITLTSTWLNGVNGVILAGAVANDNSGVSVSSAGDVNGDGFADLLVGANAADPSGRSAAGETYLVYGRGSGLPATGTLSSSWLNGTNGVILAGAKANDNSGVAVSSAGDVNGDGFADLLVGASYASPSGRLGAGETYLIYGRSNGLPATITLTNSWLNGTNGSILAGAAAYVNSGNSVSSAGDVNGDGLSDLLVGAYHANPSGSASAGETYLVYGQSNGLPAMVTLAQTWLDGTNGVILAGAAANDNSGVSVSSAGDVNGDGLADLLIGANVADPSGRSSAGETYLVYGRPGGLPSFVPLTSTWLKGLNGGLLAGAVASDNSGYSVSSAGDVNGDGLADLLVGAYYADPQGRFNAGETYLIYGRSSWLPSEITLTNTWLDGLNGVILAGAKASDNSGKSVCSAGDVNGDGFADLLVGAWKASPSGLSGAGETYLIYGRPTVRPVEPSSGSWPGNYEVVIRGTNLCNGTLSDVTSVTLCGAPAVVTGVFGSTQIVVSAGTGTSGLGDVVIYSVRYGVTTRSNAFTYIAPDIEVLGTNGLAMADGAAAAEEPGTDFGTWLAGSMAVTHTFSITNSGNTALAISGVTTSGSGAAGFTIARLPAFVDPESVEQFDVVFTPQGGRQQATFILANNSANSLFELNVTGFGLDGGIAMTTNHLVFDGVYEGADPAGQVVGVSNVGASAFTFTNVLSYSSEASGWLALTPSGSMVTPSVPTSLRFAVSLDGITPGIYWTTNALTAADATNSPQMVVVSLTVEKADQSITFPAIGDQLTTNAVGLTATADSGLAVSFAVASGPAHLDGTGTNLSFAGPGLVSIVASQAGDVYRHPAPDVTNTFRVYGLYTLTIASAHGRPFPAEGVYTNVEGSVLTNSVSSPDEQGLTQFVCTGWSLTGHEPPAGSGTEVVMTVTNHAELTWLWEANYQLDVVAGPHGSVNVPSGWQPAGVTTQLTATADPYYQFTHWSGDGSGAENPLELSMQAPKSVTANFGEIVTTNRPTPQWWLADFGLTNDFELAVGADPDHDGVPTGDEFVMDTDPIKSNSFLRVLTLDYAYSTTGLEVVSTNTVEPFEVVTQLVYEVVGYKIVWPCSTGRVYEVQYRSGMASSDWAPMDGLTNLCPIDTTLTITNRFDGSENRFYRLSVRL